MDSGREQNYWPGFVDALSNVVLTLVFVLVIFVFALVTASNKVQEKMEQITQTSSNSPTREDLGGENAQLKEQLASMTKELEKLRSETSASNRMKNSSTDQQAITAQNEEKRITIDDKDHAKANQGAIQIANANDTVILKFPLSIAEMDQKSEEQLTQALDAMGKTIGRHKIIMHSIIGKETYSVASRLAYYRAINARNVLITKLNEIPSNITISIVRPPQPEDGRVEIIFQKD